MSSAPYGSPPPPRRRGVKAGLGISLAATHLVEERYHVCVFVCEAHVQPRIWSRKASWSGHSRSAGRTIGRMSVIRSEKGVSCSLPGPP
jgi:hypothetical protein